MVSAQAPRVADCTSEVFVTVAAGDVIWRAPNCKKYGEKCVHRCCADTEAATRRYSGMMRRKDRAGLRQRIHSGSGLCRLSCCCRADEVNVSEQNTSQYNDITVLSTEELQ